MALIKRKVSTLDDQSYVPNALRIAELASDKKAKNIKIFDVQGLTLIADAFVICTATSEPQLKAVFNSVKDGMTEIGVKPLRSEGAFHGGWLLLDFGDVLVHIFREEAREFYDLDGMWGDAKLIPFTDAAPNAKPATAE